MKRVNVVFGVGYGRHKDSWEVDPDMTDAEIDEEVERYVHERLDWSYDVEED